MLDAARTLEAIPRDERAPDTDVHIVELRHLGFSELEERAAPEATQHTPADPFPGMSGAPEIDKADLDVALLTATIHHHGCLIVRGLFDAATCDLLRADVDAAFAGFDARKPFADEPATEWYAPLDPQSPYEPADPLGTAFLRSAGGVYAPHAPRAFVGYREALAGSGVLAVVEAYLGDVPVFSVNKTVLRRIGGGAQPSWHQDAYYLGVGTGALNLWLSLSTCGGDTEVMGLDILPGRQQGLAAQGTHDAVDDRAVADPVVEELAAATGRPVQRPHFEPGDGILFDQYFLHRSDIRPLPTERYAIESWFFTPTGYPHHLIPVVAT